MTLDQLRVFVAVADVEHLTRGAASVHLTPSAATAAIQALEGRYGTKLFHRIGRRLELTESGRAFLLQARAVLGAAKAAELALEELSGLMKGRLMIAASQTLATYWLPPILMRFATAHRGVRVNLLEGNTASVAASVLAGEAETGCIEGEIDNPALAIVPLAEDRLVVVAASDHPLSRQKIVKPEDLHACQWVMRERGSGTRAVFEAVMASAGGDPERLSVALELPSNEAVCGAVVGSDALTVVSELVAEPQIRAGRLRRIAFALPRRRFSLVHHKERFRSKASTAFEALMREEAQRLTRRQAMPDYQI